MPNFGYENPTNISGASPEPPEDKVFRIVRETWAKYADCIITYDMLLGAGCDRDVLEKYGTLEELYDAVVADIIERIGIAYAPITEDARNYMAGTEKTRDLGMQKLERLLYLHTYLCIHPKNRTYVLLCSQEDHLPAEYREDIAKAVEKNFMSVLTAMILEVSEVKNSQTAALLACSAIGSINTYIQQPELVKWTFRDATRLDPNYSVIEDYMNNIILRSVWANTSINKPF